MLTTIVNFITAVAGIIVAFFSSIVNFFTSAINMATLVFDVIGWFPSVIAAGVTFVIVGAIIKLVIGR